MRVLLFANSYPPKVGGLEEAVKNIASEMARRGHSVVILTDSLDCLVSQCKKEGNILIIRVPFALPRLVRNEGGHIFQSTLRRTFLSPLTAPVTLTVVAWIIRRFRPDIVNLHYIGDNAFFCLLAKRFVNFRLAVNIHGHDINRFESQGPLAKKIIRSTLRSSDRVLSNSQALLNSAIAIEPEVKAKCGVVGNGVYLEPFMKDLEAPFKESYILSLGNLVYIKGVDILIRAYQVLKQEGEKTRLVIAGDGPEFFGLQELTKSLKVEDSVLFVGAVSRDNVPAWFKGCTLFVLPSRREGFGIVLLEAMASRKAIVAAESGGVSELVINGVNGILVPPESPEKLAAGIRELLNDKEKREEMGEAGYKIVADRFTWPRIVDGFLKEYEKALNS